MLTKLCCKLWSYMSVVLPIGIAVIVAYSGLLLTFLFHEARDRYEEAHGGPTAYYFGKPSMAKSLLSESGLMCANCTRTAWLVYLLSTALNLMHQRCQPIRRLLFTVLAISGAAYALKLQVGFYMGGTADWREYSVLCAAMLLTTTASAGVGAPRLVHITAWAGDHGTRSAHRHAAVRAHSGPQSSEYMACTALHLSYELTLAGVYGSYAGIYVLQLMSQGLGNPNDDPFPNPTYALLMQNTAWLPLAALFHFGVAGHSLPRWLQRVCSGSAIFNWATMAILSYNCMPIMKYLHASTFPTCGLVCAVFFLEKMPCVSCELDSRARQSVPSPPL